MKHIIILGLLCIFYSCNNPVKKIEELNDFKINTYHSYYLDNEVLLNFISDYINLPENRSMELFTLYIDQRMDTLLFTIWRYPLKSFDLENSFGYFYCQGKLVIIYSPFHKVFTIKSDAIKKNEFISLLEKEINSNNKQGDGIVMWQLQILYHGNQYKIQKDHNKIFNTTKAPTPDSSNMEVKYY